MAHVTLLLASSHSPISLVGSCSKFDCIVEGGAPNNQNARHARASEQPRNLFYLGLQPKGQHAKAMPRNATTAGSPRSPRPPHPTRAAPDTSHARTERVPPCACAASRRTLCSSRLRLAARSRSAPATPAAEPDQECFDAQSRSLAPRGPGFSNATCAQPTLRDRGPGSVALEFLKLHRLSLTTTCLRCISHPPLWYECWVCDGSQPRRPHPAPNMWSYSVLHRFGGLVCAFCSTGGRAAALKEVATPHRGRSSGPPLGHNCPRLEDFGCPGDVLRTTDVFGCFSRTQDGVDRRA
eukprot:COSAG05_NODE_3877_length_1794_cov_1.487316_3_plen_295_part_00